MPRVCFFWQRKKKLIDEDLLRDVKEKLGIVSVEKICCNAENNPIANDESLVEDGVCYDINCPPSQDFEENFDGNEDFYYTDIAQDETVLDEKDFDIPDDNPLPKGELNNSSKRRIWGELALKLREMSCMTLHSACTEVHDLTLVDGVLTAYVKDEFTLKILTEKENFDKISLVLKQIDDRISLQVVLKRPQNNKIVQNLQILKDLFGDDLIVK